MAAIRVLRKGFVSRWNPDTSQSALLYYYYRTGYLPTYEVDYPTVAADPRGYVYIRKASGGLYLATSSHPTGDVSILPGDVRGAVLYLVEKDPITTPDLAVSKTANSSIYLPQGAITYNVAVQNFGAGLASGVVVTDASAQRCHALVSHHQPRRSLHAPGRQLGRLQSG